jgi:hypothetical protein
VNSGALDDQNGANNNGGVKAQNGSVDGRPLVASLHHFDEEQDPNLCIRFFVKSRIWSETDTGTH